MRIAVGFGPRTAWNSFHQAGEKLAAALQEDPRFSCGFFGREPWSVDEMSRFDILVFIKHYPPLVMLDVLKNRGKTLVLDWHDKALYPSFCEKNIVRRFLKKIYYFRTERVIKKQLRMFDVCIAASPALVPILGSIGAKARYLPRQLYNDANESRFKQSNDRTHGLMLYWTGVGTNQAQNEPILSALKRLHDGYGCRIVYSTDEAGNADFIEYRTWNADTWEEEMLEADIAFRWRDDSIEQQLKDPNKVLSYMGAGLPVVCYPTESEKAIVENNVTGIFAYTPEEFEKAMIRLITHPELRAAIGEAAHKEVWSKYSLHAHAQRMKRVLLDLYGKRADNQRLDTM